MGAWGMGSFENDGASDFLLDVADDGADRVIAAIDAVTAADAGEDIEAPDGTEAIAAAEIVAAVHGRPLPDAPEEEFTAAVEACREGLPADIRDRARQTVTRVRDAEESELRQLWAEADEYDQWVAGVNDLLERLG